MHTAGRSAAARPRDGLRHTPLSHPLPCASTAEFPASGVPQLWVALKICALRLFDVEDQQFTVSRFCIIYSGSDHRLLSELELNSYLLIFLNSFLFSIVL